MKILHVIDHLGLGGAQAVLLDLVRHCPGVEVAVLHGRGVFHDAIVKEGVPVHSLASSRMSPWIIPRLARLVQGFDLLHFHLQGSNWMAKPLMALGSGRPCIAHDHSSGDLAFRGIPSLVPDALSHLWSGHIIAVSEGVRDFLCRYEACPRDKVTVIPNGVETDRFRPPTADERASARRAFGVTESDIILGAIGRLSPEKNFLMLCEIARCLPGHKILLAGEGPERGALEQSAPANLVLLGSISDREQFYSALDALVLPSLFEGLPMALLEAMSCGLPVVASRLPDIERALGKSGCLADPRDRDSFLNPLSEICRDRAMAARMGEMARRRCLESHSASTMASQVLALSRELLNSCIA